MKNNDKIMGPVEITTEDANLDISDELLFREYLDQKESITRQLEISNEKLFRENLAQKVILLNMRNIRNRSEKDEKSPVTKNKL